MVPLALLFLICGELSLYSIAARHFLDLPLASIGGRVRTAPLAEHLGAYRRTGRFREQADFLELIGKVFGTEIDLDDDCALAGRWTFKHRALDEKTHAVLPFQHSGMPHGWVTNQLSSPLSWCRLTGRDGTIVEMACL